MPKGKKPDDEMPPIEAAITVAKTSATEWTVSLMRRNPEGGLQVMPSKLSKHSAIGQIDKLRDDLVYFILHGEVPWRK